MKRTCAKYSKLTFYVLKFIFSFITLFQLSLSIFSGSESVEPGTEVELTCSRGVGLRDPTFQEQFARSLKLTFPGGESFQTLSLSLLVRSELENKKDSSTIEVVISVSNPWTGVSKDITLHFVPVIYSTFNLLTAMSKKFLQITVFSPCARNFVLTDGALEVVNQDQFSNLLVTPINQKYPEVVISKQFEGSFLWELGVGEGEKDPPAKVRFSVSYAPEDGTEAARSYSAVYQFQDYRTLFTINAKVEPAKGKHVMDLLQVYKGVIVFDQTNFTEVVFLCSHALFSHAKSFYINPISDYYIMYDPFIAPAVESFRF